MKKADIEDSQNQIVWIDPRLLAKSPLNPRTHFDPEKIEELCASFREHGFTAELSHLLVRPASAEGVKYEIVCGHRRWVAATTMGLDRVPAVVRPMNDARVILIQLVENLQREGLTPLEEAEGYRAALEMRDESGAPLHTPDSLAKLVGKDRRTIEDRVRLCRLRGSFTGQILETGELPVSHARLLARIPSPTVRDQIAKRVLTPPDGLGPMHYRQLERLIHDECMVQLRGADFPVSDAELLPVRKDGNGDRVAGGACTDCPYNTRNMEDGGGSKFHMCLNVECFREKRVSAHERWMESETDPEGGRVALPLVESEKLFDLTGTRLAYNSGYIDLDEAPPEHDLKRGVQNPPAWKKLVRGRGVQVVVAKDGGGRVRELALHKLALQAARENDAELPVEDRIFKAGEQQKRSEPDDPTIPKYDGASPVADAAQHEIDRRREKQRDANERDLLCMRAQFEAVVSAAAEAARGGSFKGPKGFWFAATALMLDVTDEHGDAPSVASAIIEKRDDNAAAGLRKYLGKIEGSEPSLVAFFMRMILHFYSGETQLKEGLKSWAKVLGVNLAEIRKTEMARIASEKASEAKLDSIKARLEWVTELRENAEDFEWNSSGVCEAPDRAKVHIGLTAAILVAKTEKGWVASFVAENKKSGAGSFPAMNTVKYGSRGAAVRVALLSLNDWCKTLPKQEKSVAAIEEYLATIATDEPKKATVKAPKPKSAKLKTKAGKRRGG